VLERDQAFNFIGMTLEIKEKTLAQIVHKFYTMIDFWFFGIGFIVGIVVVRI